MFKVKIFEEMRNVSKNVKREKLKIFYKNYGKMTENL